MRAPFLLLLLLLPVPPAAGAGTVIVFDRTSIGPTEGEPPGRDGRALVAARLDPRVGSTVLPLPVAWMAEGQEVRLDADVQQELAAAAFDLEAAARVGRRLASRAAEAGEALPLLEPGETAGLLQHESRATGGAGRHRAATERVLTRGNVRDRWSVPEPISDPDPEAPPVELPAGRLLRVDLVSLGLVTESDGLTLPPRFAHVGLRARLWNLRTGLREWDRALLLGRVLGEDPELGGAWRAAAEALLDEAADLLAAELWPELDVPAPATGEAAADARAGSPPPPLAAAPVPLPERQGLDGLLERLAAARLSEPPAGSAWTALAIAVRKEAPKGLRLALDCAEDPLGLAVDLGSKRLGLGLAETHRRVEGSEAFRRALAEDLLEQVAAAVGDDWPLERGVRFLLRDLAGREPGAAEAAAAAEPLLRRARLDGARSPESLGALLLAARIWPEGAQATLEELLRRDLRP